jgi:SAM-dependent methyltransferase
MPASVRSDIEDFAAVLGAGSRVLEIGSGGGRDAALMEELGLQVRRTDITSAFVELLREQGHEADVLDPLTDDLASADGSYDAVWANASLLHVAREDLPTVLRRLADVTRIGGLLRIAVKEGDGDGWSTHGSIAGPRHFTYWREAPLGALVEGAGWRAVVVDRAPGVTPGESWLKLRAVRA